MCPMAKLTRPEVLRQLVHLAQVWMVVALALAGLDITLFIVLAATLISLVAEQYRRRASSDGLWQRWVLQHVIRPSEASQWLGSTYLFLGSLATLVLAKVFEQAHLLTTEHAVVAATASLVMLTVGDSLSSIMGQALGGPHVRHSRRWSGLLGFVLAAALAWWLLPISLFTALLLVIVASLTEVFTPNGLDDNIAIPVACFVIMLL
jgi:dolichol kinase